MRPPYGAWKKEMEENTGMIAVLWNVDPLDWNTDNETEIVNKVVTETEENDIILLHDCYLSSVKAALRIIDIMQAKGYEFVTVDEFFAGLKGEVLMDLFDYMRETTKEKESPLASRLRPTTLDEVVGQQHIIGKDKLLYRAIKADKLSSVIFYGPPGTGKTTLAKVIANTTSAEFTQINATVAGKKDME